MAKSLRSGSLELSRSRRVSCTFSVVVVKHQRRCSMLYARQPRDEESQELKCMIRQEVGRVGRGLR
jgi:hypothetical protein